jgi:hypothetical protein
MGIGDVPPNETFNDIEVSGWKFKVDPKIFPVLSELTLDYDKLARYPSLTIKGLKSSTQPNTCC